MKTRYTIFYKNDNNEEVFITGTKPQLFRKLKTVKPQTYCGLEMQRALTLVDENHNESPIFIRDFFTAEEYSVLCDKFW